LHPTAVLLVITMAQTADLSSLLPLLIPIFLLELGLMVFALLDLRRRATTRGPKWIWVLIILFVNLLGPILYFLIGREE